MFILKLDYFSVIIIRMYFQLPWCEPQHLYQILRDHEPSFLLESRGGSYKTSRYSFIGIHPRIIIKSKDKKISFFEKGKYLIKDIYGNPFQILKEVISQRSRECRFIKNLPLPFPGGMAGYIGYDMVHHIERLPATTIDDLKLPDMFLMEVDKLIGFDHLNRQAWLITEQSDLEEYGRYLSGLIQRRADKLSNMSIYGDSRKIIKPLCNMSRKEYIRMVEYCKEYISAGDIFQANLSQRFAVPIEGIDPFYIYSILTKINPSPFSAFINGGDFHIVCGSPERLVRCTNNVVETRPIAGTVRRGKNEREEASLIKALFSSPKECAEHIMLIDLERNDLGKVCVPGTVRVDELMVGERYSHVIHIVSNIKGTLAPGKDLIDIIIAMFPGGTITGVPKVRCMEIIDELEPTRRGPYTGSIGYITYWGNMDLNIIIRSFIIKDGWAYIQVGGGIVADSDPEREYEETLHKGAALFRALEIAKGAKISL